MPMLADPSTKYVPYTAVPFPEGYVRKWPTRRSTTAPRWLSTDLRDGNQALVNPMSNATKTELFRKLVQIGFKEIEVSYPSAGEQEFNFTRSLIDNGEIPDDVAIQIITPARADLIEKSIAALAGAKHAIIHLYNATSPIFREVVFRNSQEKTVDLVLNAVRLIKKLTEETTARTGTHFTLNYCLETFSQTEPEFAVELGNKVLAEWGRATPENKMMFNLAATVECAPSNFYADLVEYFSNNINNRESVILSIHPHNDRGTAVAAAENGLLAGGDRIEGCLLGNGERTGNVDLITLALNLYSQGVSPNLDFSDLPEIVKLVCRCNEMDVPVRYPYAGTLVFSAFAGTHQDAIAKGLTHQEKRWAKVDQTGDGIKSWHMPYIPVDPKDLGYGYENLIRVSSQSGKAGSSFVVKQLMSLELPRQMQVEFYQVVQKESEASGKEMTTQLVTDAFKKSYTLSSVPSGRLFLHSFRLTPLSPSSREPSSPLSDYSDDPEVLSSTPEVGVRSLLRFEGELSVDGGKRVIRGEGPSPIPAIIDALRADVNLSLTTGEFASHSINAQNVSQQKTASYLELRSETSGKAWGVGVSSDVMTSKFRAVISAANRLIGDTRVPPIRGLYSPRPTLADTRAKSWLNEVTIRTGRSPARSPAPRSDGLVVPTQT